MLLDEEIRNKYPLLNILGLNTSVYTKNNKFNLEYLRLCLKDIPEEFYSYPYEDVGVFADYVGFKREELNRNFELLEYMKPMKYIDNTGLGFKFNYDVGIEELDDYIFKLLNRDFIVCYSRVGVALSSDKDKKDNLELRKQYKETHTINYLDLEKYPIIKELWINASEEKREELWYYITLMNTVLSTTALEDFTRSGLELNEIVKGLANLLSISFAAATKLLLISELNMNRVGNMLIHEKIKFKRTGCLFNYLNCGFISNKVTIEVIYGLFNNLNLKLFKDSIKNFILRNESEILFISLINELYMDMHTISDYNFLFCRCVESVLGRESIIKYIEVKKESIVIYLKKCY